MRELNSVEVHATAGGFAGAATLGTLFVGAIAGAIVNSWSHLGELDEEFQRWSRERSANNVLTKENKLLQDTIDQYNTLCGPLPVTE